MPRILMLSQEVHPVPPLKGAAVEQWMDAVAQRLNIWEPMIVSVPHPHRPDSETVGRVTYRRLRMGRVYKRLFRKLTRLDPYSYLDRVAAVAREFKPDLIHLHNAPAFVDGLVHRLPQVPVILHMHNEMRPAFSSQVAALVGCSRYIADWYRDRAVPAAGFHVLPNGVDIESIEPGAVEERKELRRRFDIPDSRFVIMYAGRMSPEKGPDLLLEAFSRLNPERFRLVMLGEWREGGGKDDERANYCMQLRRQATAQGAAVAVLGHFPPAEAQRLYALADLLVIPSRFEEPFSMVAIEAMAAGVPVLALRRGGMVEYMRDGENAALLDPTSTPDDLAKAIEHLAADPGQLGRIAAAARRQVCEFFSWPTVAAKTEALYERVLGEAGR